MNYTDIFPQVVAHAKEHGFVFPSSEIYDGLAATYDYGPLGVLMKNNLKQLWWTAMVQFNAEIHGMDAAILMHPKVWKASGHVDAFNDPLIDNKDSKKRYRADVLIEDQIGKYEKKAEKDAKKKAIKEGWEIGDETYNGFLNKSRNGKKANDLREQYQAVLASGDLQQLGAIIEEQGIACPESGTKNWTEVRQFNLMFSTQLGTVAGDEGKIYLRPETAQGSYVNFLNVMKSQHMSLPFGIAAIGKAFRNEIVARQFIFRMREFEQMEMQYFVKPGSQQAWFDKWRERREQFHRILGLDDSKIRIHEHDKLAHYADAAVDIEFDFPFGFKELEGIHSRTDFDLGRHEEMSGKKLRFYDNETKESYIPYVVETALGVDRLFLAHYCNAFSEEEAPTAEGGTAKRLVLKLHPLVAPTKVAILPLVRTDEALTKAAREIHSDLSIEFQAYYDEKGTIGRRYRRQDERGTPYCVTIDEDTVSDELVTVRDRDTMQQERIPVNQLRDNLRKKLDMRQLLG